MKKNNKTENTRGKTTKKYKKIYISFIRLHITYEVICNASVTECVEEVHVTFLLRTACSLEQLEEDH
jgi:hypothetical protein